MDRMTAQARRFYHHVENGGTLSKSDVGRMVEYCEAKDAEISRMQAEIERLEKEVERLNDDLNGRKRADDITIYNAAWNDAIEAAAETASEWWAYLHDDQDRDGPVAAAIRALKRSQE